LRGSRNEGLGAEGNTRMTALFEDILWPQRSEATREVMDQGKDRWGTKESLGTRIIKARTQSIPSSRRHFERRLRIFRERVGKEIPEETEAKNKVWGRTRGVLLESTRGG